MHRPAQLCARFTGVPAAGMNPGWRGQVVADALFAALRWSRLEPRCSGARRSSPRSRVTRSFSISTHSTRSEQRRRFSSPSCSRMIGGASASLPAGRFPTIQVSRAQAGAGHAFKLCAFESRPLCAFRLFSRRIGRLGGPHGAWRPRKRLRGVLPEVLEPLSSAGGTGAIQGPRRHLTPRCSLALATELDIVEPLSPAVELLSWCARSQYGVRSITAAMAFGFLRRGSAGAGCR